MSANEHQHDSMLVKKKDSLGRYRVTFQCRTCGRVDTAGLRRMGFGTWVPVSALDGPVDALPDFDETASEKFCESERARWKKEFEEREAKRLEELEEQRRIRREEYDAFRKTRRWYEKRMAVIKRDGNVCQACLRRPIDEVHHKTYVHGVDCPLFDLVGVCRICHQAIHFGKEMAR